MAPTVHPFHPADLETHVKKLPTGKLRKPDKSQPLQDCALMEIMQFECQVKAHKKHKMGIVTCEPIQRVFRSRGSCFVGGGCGESFDDW
ncbi:hypothetical protein E4T42_00691 [Aureobasidium subglaciale]|nr:hypothetical protein E4T42_00691 [Aureobasidium subglaciale]